MAELKLSIIDAIAAYDEAERETTSPLLQGGVVELHLGVEESLMAMLYQWWQAAELATVEWWEAASHLQLARVDGSRRSESPRSHDAAGERTAAATLVTEPEGACGLRQVENETRRRPVELVAAMAEEPDGAGAEHPEPELFHVVGSWIVTESVDDRIVPGCDVDLIDRWIRRRRCGVG